MVRVFLRVRDGDGGVTTHPLSAFEYLESSPLHTVYAVLKTGPGYPLRALAQCRSQEEARYVEKSILNAIAIAVFARPSISDPENRVHIIDLNSIAADYLEAFHANNSLDGGV
jgi:hypothetical protein